jgi:hypothetical protein
VRARIARRSDDELDVCAEQGGHRFRRAFEDDGLEVSCIAADCFQQLRGADLILSERRREAHRDRVWILLQALDQVLAVTDR